MLPAEVARLGWITPSSGMRTVLTVCWLLLCNIVCRRLRGVLAAEATRPMRITASEIFIILQMM